METNMGHIKENIKQGVKHEMDKGVWSDRYHAVQDKAREAVDASEDFVRVHPFYTILGAATVGFVAGVLLRRRK